MTLTAVRVPEPILDAISRAAQHHGQNRSQWLRAAIEDALLATADELYDELVSTVDPETGEQVFDLIAAEALMEGRKP